MTYKNNDRTVQVIYKPTTEISSDYLIKSLTGSFFTKHLLFHGAISSVEQQQRNHFLYFLFLYLSSSIKTLLQKKVWSNKFELFCISFFIQERRNFHHYSRYPVDTLWQNKTIFLINQKKMEIEWISLTSNLWLFSIVNSFLQAFKFW